MTETPDLEPRTNFTIQEFCALHGLTRRTVLQMINQSRLLSFNDNGIVKIPDPGWLKDSKIGTGSPEDIYCLRGVEVSDLLKITPRWVRYLCQKGRLSCVFVGRQRRYSLTDIRRLIAQREQIGPYGKWKMKKPKRTKVRQNMVAWARKRLAGLDQFRRKSNDAT